jgi:hypothetical protein
MSVKTRTLPDEVSSWMEKDVKIQKLDIGSRWTCGDCKENIHVSREFFANVHRLSSERYRKIVQLDFEKKLFLKTQRHKAETNLPGLLPFVYNREISRLRS